MSLTSTFARRRHRLARLALAVATALGAASAAAADNSPWCAERCDELVLDWNATAHQVIKAADGYANPLAASRALAMMHLAMHDAVNAVAPRYASYAVMGTALDADPALAAVSAAHDVLLALYPAQKALLRATLDKSLHDADIGAAAKRGAELGRAVAAAVLARRSNDGSDANETYREGSKAGAYRFVPGTDMLAAPHWRRVTPFALNSAQQFRVGAPVAANPTRSFPSFSAAALENADSRVRAGLHFRFATVEGLRLGRQVGTHTVATLLTPTS